MYRIGMILVAVIPSVLLLNPWLGQRGGLTARETSQRIQVATTHTKDKSVVGIYLEALTADGNGDIWVVGSVFLQQGLLFRTDGRETIARALPYVSTITNLVFTGRGAAWMIANHNHLYRSNNGGVTWQKSFSSETNLTSICFSDAVHGWVAGWHGSIFHTADGGVLWRKQNSGTDYDLKQIQFVDPLHGWAVGGKWRAHPLNKWTPIFIATNDGGRTWNSISLSPFIPHLIAFVDERRGWGLDAQYNILHTNDGGETWMIQHKGGEARLSSLFFLNDREGWAVGEEVLHTDDGGQTWYWINEDFELPGQLDRVIFTSSGEGWGIEEYGSYNSPHVYHTTDGGKTWDVVPDNWKQEIIEKVHRSKSGRRLR